MGDVVFLQAYRNSPPAIPERAQDAAPVSALVQACRAMSDSVRRMQAASRQLAAASADLRDLARGDI
jgi:hypothetical protein